jgi:hypothetical protein
MMAGKTKHGPSTVQSVGKVRRGRVPGKRSIVAPGRNERHAHPRWPISATKADDSAEPQRVRERERRANVFICVFIFIFFQVHHGSSFVVTTEESGACHLVAWDEMR